jgi:capsular polysaccharide transport system ATP-binding protein
LETTTVIIVSHQAKTLERFARSAAVLKDGQLIIFDSLEEAKQLYDYETQGTEIPDTTAFEQHG